jgi:hypothetical protein
MSAQKKIAIVPGPVIEPDLKAFIDRVVIPILVREFLAGPQGEKKIAKMSPDVASCAVTPSAVEVAR